jgi:hypothetical protein
MCRHCPARKNCRGRYHESTHETKTPMNHLSYVLANDKEVFRYLKSRFPVYHLSNIFFRDIHYGIMEYLRERKMTVRYQDGEKIARAFAEKLEHEKIFRPLDRQTWMVQYEDFRTPQVTKTVAPAAGQAAPAPGKGAPGATPAGATPPAATVHAAGAGVAGHAPGPRG